MSAPDVEGVARLYVEIKVEPDQLRTWPDERITLLFDGIAKAIAAGRGELSQPSSASGEPTEIQHAYWCRYEDGAWKACCWGQPQLHRGFFGVATRKAGA